MASKENVFKLADCQNKSIQILVLTKIKDWKLKRKEKQNLNKHCGLFNYLYINPIILLSTDSKNVLMEDNKVGKCTAVSVLIIVLIRKLIKTIY